MKNVIGEIQAIIMETVLTRPEVTGEQLFYSLLKMGYDSADCVTAIKQLEAIVNDDEPVETPQKVNSTPSINIRAKGGLH